jgi:histidyl-tRNA synthetase
VGISIGFERAVDLVEQPQELDPKALVLVLSEANPVVIGNALKIQAEAIAAGYRVRIETRPKKLNILLEQLAENGFGSFASVNEDSANFSALELRSLAK